MTGRGWALDSARSSLLPQPHLPRPHLPRPLAFSPAARNAPVRVSATAARLAASCAPRPRAPRRAGSYEERVVSVTAAMRTQYDPARDSPRRNELKRKDVAFEEVGAGLPRRPPASLESPTHPPRPPRPPTLLSPLPRLADPAPPWAGRRNGGAARFLWRAPSPPRPTTTAPTSRHGCPTPRPARREFRLAAEAASPLPQRLPDGPGVGGGRGGFFWCGAPLSGRPARSARHGAPCLAPCHGAPCLGAPCRQVSPAGRAAARGTILRCGDEHCPAPCLSAPCPKWV